MRVGRRLRELRSRSEEHTSELQSRFDLVCRLLREKKNVQEGVLREVVMPEPASRERYVCVGEVEGGPVPDGVDRLDALLRRRILVEVRERCGPRRCFRG